MAPKPEQIDSGSQQIARIDDVPRVPAEFAQQLQMVGVDMSAVRVPRVPHFWKVSWDELCTIPTKDPKTMASPLCLVREIIDQPEAEQAYDAYIGMIVVRLTTENMEDLYFTHSRCYAATGEYLPLTEWLRSQPTPFVCRFGYIETRKVGRHVVRALPVNIPLG